MTPAWVGCRVACCTQCLCGPCSPGRALEGGTLTRPAGLDASTLWQKASPSTRGGPFARLCRPGQCPDLRGRLVSDGIRRRVEIFAELGNRPRTDVQGLRRRLHILRTRGPCRMDGVGGIVAAGRSAVDHADYGGLAECRRPYEGPVEAFASATLCRPTHAVTSLGHGI